MKKQPLKKNAVSMHILMVLEPHLRRPGYVSTLLVHLGLLWVVRPQNLIPVFFSFFFVRC